MLEIAGRPFLGKDRSWIPDDDERPVDRQLCRLCGQLLSSPTLHLAPHRFKISLHPIHADRKRVSEREMLRVFPRTGLAARDSVMALSSVSRVRALAERSLQSTTTYESKSLVMDITALLAEA